MLTELCQELHNWFDRERYTGTFEIRGGKLTAPVLVEGQYYRIIGSLFNDGVHLYDDEDLKDETFVGAVWSMAVPMPVILLAEDIKAWRDKYESADSSAMSPYMSESFGGYSYQKGSAFTGTGSGGGTSWKSTFAERMNVWRKL